VLWDEGGLQIHTTLDPQAQAAAQRSVTDHVYATDQAAAAITLVQPGTGDIMAMAQSRPYGPGDHQTELNYNVDRTMGGGSGFQTGSTFKPVTAAAALQAGITMKQEYPSPYKDNYPPMQDCAGDDLPAVPGDQNDSPDLVGPYIMPDAMAQSVNTYFVPLEAQAGLCNVVLMAQRLGLGHQAVTDRPGHLKAIDQVQSLTLGTNNFTPLQMADVYATFAARGRYCTPVALTAVIAVTSNDRRQLPLPASLCRQVMRVGTSDAVTSMLNGVVQDGTGKPAGLSDRDDAGKTGTTDGHRQVWFSGFTTQLAGAAVVSDTAAPLESLNNRTYGGVYVGNAFGGTLAGPIWKDAMSGALSGQPAIDLPSVTLPDPPPDDPNYDPSTDPNADPTANATTQAAKKKNAAHKPGTPAAHGAPAAGSRPAAHPDAAPHRPRPGGAGHRPVGHKGRTTQSESGRVVAQD
jgi:membrane peptidoglycan carboxypeptidase